MTRIAAVVLNHRHWPATLGVLESLESQSTRPVCVVVVDNGSGEAEVDAIRAGAGDRYRVLPLGRNDGYAAGMNAGIRDVARDRPDAILLLTHDVRLEPDCLRLLSDELQRHADTAVAAPVLGWDRRDDVTWSAGGELTGVTGTPWHPDKGSPLHVTLRAPSRSVAWADGAVLLVRREALDRHGPLPEQYFLYFEEVDFQTRIRRHGGAVRVVSGALAWQAPGRTPRYLAARNQILLLRAHRRRALPFFLATVVLSCAREAAKRLLGRSPDMSVAMALWFGIVDGLTGRLRRELFELA